MITSGPAVQGGPYNLISGQSVTVTPGQQSAQQAYGYVVVYNNSGFICQVQGLGGTQYLQPLQADVYPMPPGTGATGGPVVTPVTNSLAAGIYCGTLTATFLPLVSPLPPPGFPLPLTAYPGGQVPIAFNAPPTGSVGIGPPFGGTATIAVPVGTSQLILAVDPSAGTLDADAASVALVGVQTGAEYLVTATIDPGSPLTVPVSPADDSFNLTWYGLSPRSPPHLDIYASNLAVNPNAAGINPVALGVPGYAVSVVNVAALGQLLAAPTAGAYYLFEWGMWASASASDAIGLYSVVYLDEFVWSISSYVTYNSPPLGPYRTTAAVSVASVAGSGISPGGIWLRFALGP